MPLEGRLFAWVRLEGEPCSERWALARRGGRRRSGRHGKSASPSSLDEHRCHRHLVTRRSRLTRSGAGRAQSGRRSAVSSGAGSADARQGQLRSAALPPDIGAQSVRPPGWASSSRQAGPPDAPHSWPPTTSRSGGSPPDFPPSIKQPLELRCRRVKDADCGKRNHLRQCCREVPRRALHEVTPGNPGELRRRPKVA